MDRIRRALIDTLDDDHPATVRQVFYRLVAGGVIAKSEGEYKSTVCRLLVQLRESGDVPYGWISDNTRWQRKAESYDDASTALRITAQAYRRALWNDQPHYVEVWIEKDALAGVLIEETNPWDVPLMVSKGFASITYLHAAALAIAARRKPAHVYLFTDYDRSGIGIAGQIERRLRQYAPMATIHVERLAVTPEQIERWQLPTRPAKDTDVSRGWMGGECVDLDAIPPRLLRQLAREAIERHVDVDALRVTATAEAEEKRWFERLVAEVG
jgi:hypothetical protein